MECRTHHLLRLACLVAWGLTGTIGLAQQPPAPPATPAIAAGNAPPAHISRGVKGFPYSADMITVRTQTLADGTTITHQSRMRVYRDNDGRMRNEFFGDETATGEASDTPLTVIIADSVADVSYHLNPRTRTASRTNRQRPVPRSVQTPPAPSTRPPVQPQTMHEELGTQVVEGLLAKGTRITQTYEAGAIGNDRPIVVTSEDWYSQELQIMVLNSRNDPRTGDSETRLTNLSRDEPPAELFQVPADYTMEELQPVTSPSPAPE